MIRRPPGPLSSRGPIKRHRPRQDGGFTLTELMVVVVILALLAAIAVPALTKDDEEERFEKFVSSFMRDLQRQRYGSISSKEDRLVEIGGTSYLLQTLVGTTRSPMEQREAQLDCFIAGVNLGNPSGMPGNSYTTPSNSAMTGTQTIRFLGTGGAQVELSTDNWQSQPATIFFGTRSGRYKKRIVIFPATAYADLYQDW